MSDNGIPFGSEATYKVHKVEEKKRGTSKPKDGQPGRAYVIYKLGLEAPNGHKFWAEMFCGEGSNPPAEGSAETLFIKAADNPEWLPGAARPRKGGRGGGGGRGRSPRERGRIERQHSQEMAIRVVSLLWVDSDPQGEETVKADLIAWTNFFVADLDNAKASQ